jgi:hypothetical protein
MSAREIIGAPDNSLLVKTIGEVVLAKETFEKIFMQDEEVRKQMAELAKGMLNLFARIFDKIKDDERYKTVRPLDAGIMLSIIGYYLTRACIFELLARIGEKRLGGQSEDMEWRAQLMDHCSNLLRISMTIASYYDITTDNPLPTMPSLMLQSSVAENVLVEAMEKMKEMDKDRNLGVFSYM